MSKILITGAYGFMGRNLVDAWHKRHDMFGVDVAPDLWQNVSLEAFHNTIPILHYDLCQDVFRLDPLLTGVDVVVHCANRARIPPSWRTYGDYYDINIRVSQEVFEQAQKRGVKTFVYFSSSSVYGNSLYPCQQEADRLYPTNPYAVSKMAAEHALLVQAERGDTRLIIIRPFTMYGDYMNYSKDGLVIARFLRAWMDQEPLLLEGGGHQTRDFVHASDAVRALELIIKHGEHKSIYNIGSGKSVSIKQLADCVSSRQIIAPERLGAVAHTCADINKLRALGYEPQVDVLEWLTAQVEKLKLKIYNKEETL